MSVVVIVIVVADQITKHAIRASLPLGEESKVLPGIALVDTRNRGVAFGFIPGDQVLVMILIGVALVALLTYFARNSSRPLVWLPTGMLLGGALGNILDRIREGSVTDFVKLPLGFPPFNLADSSITIGMVILILLLESSRARRGARQDPGSGPQRDRRAGGVRAGDDDHKPVGPGVEPGR
jgi:signal peptidase II